MLLFSSEIACFPLRLNWDEKVIQTLSPSAWWLHTTIAGLLGEAGGLQGRQILEKILKKRRRRESWGAEGEMFLKPPGCSNVKQRVHGDQIAQGLAPGSPLPQSCPVEPLTAKPKTGHTWETATLPTWVIPAGMREGQYSLEARVGVGFSGPAVYRCSLSSLGICPMQGTLWSEKG